MKTLSDSFGVWVGAEKALVGMLLKNSGQLTEALATGIEPRMFCDELSRKVFSSIVKADQEGRVVTIRDCYALLPDLSAEVAELVSKAPVAQNLTYYANEVVNGCWQRETYKRLLALADAVADREAFSSMEGVRARVIGELESAGYGDNADSRGPKAMSQILGQVMTDIEQQVGLYRSGQPTGIPTGIWTIDQITGGGLKPGHYTIVAARPGIGKTALAVSVCHNAANAGHRAAFFTVEMTTAEIAKRFISRESGVPGGRIDLGSLSGEEIDKVHNANQRLYESLIHIDDSTGGSFEAFESACRRIKRQHGLSLVVLDYVQLFHIGKQSANRVGMLTEISNRLKRLSLELKISVIVVSQINREADKEGGAPSLHQLKDTGALEQDADLALLLYQENDSVFVKVAKNRRGKWGFVFPVKADLATNRFEEERLA